MYAFLAVCAFGGSVLQFNVLKLSGRFKSNERHLSITTENNRVVITHCVYPEVKTGPSIAINRQRIIEVISILISHYFIFT